jgi:hypothetical protein
MQPELQAPAVAAQPARGVYGTIFIRMRKVDALLR